MIKLIDLLETTTSEDTKAAQQRRRKFRMIFEGGEVGQVPQLARQGFQLIICDGEESQIREAT